MNLDVLTSETAPEPSRAILDGIANDLGFVPNLAAVAATSPTLLAAFDGLRRVVGSPTVPPVHREIAGLAVGVAVDNAYGVAFHSTVLAALGVDERDIDEMRAGGEPADPVNAAVYRFARAIAVERGQVGDDVVDAGLRRWAQRHRPAHARRRMRLRRSRRHHRQPRRSRPPGRVPLAAPVESVISARCPSTVSALERLCPHHPPRLRRGRNDPMLSPGSCPRPSLGPWPGW